MSPDAGDGRLNVLTNTVGTSAVGTFEHLTDDQWLAAVDDGAMGMVRCVRRPALAAQRGMGPQRELLAHSTQRQSVMLPAYTAARIDDEQPRTRSWSTWSPPEASRPRR